METLFILILVAVNIGITARYFAAIPAHTIWVMPFTFFVLNHLLQYPLRALYLVYFSTDIDFTPEQIIFALLYATIFIYVFITVSLMLIRTHFVDLPALVGRKNEVQPGPGENVYKVLLVVILAMVVYGIYYKIMNNQIYGLYSELSDVQFNWYEVLLQSFTPLRWFAVFYAYLTYRRNANKLYLFFALVIMGSILLESVLTTSKGNFVYILFVYLMTRNLAQKPVNKYYAVVGLSVAVLFAVYSYLARYFGVVSGEFNASDIAVTFTSALDNLDSWREFALTNIFDRFNYLDGLMLVQAKIQHIDKAYFQFGSVSELLNFIPRYLWPDRPLISFNHYMTTTVWEYDVLSENPIGRVGESYFVFGYFGIVMAFLYAYLFSTIYATIFAGKSDVSKSIYLFLLIVYILPDAYLFYGVTNTAISLTMMAVLVMTVRLVLGSGPERKGAYGIHGSHAGPIP